MSKSRRLAHRRPVAKGILAGERRKSAPHEFVLDAIASLTPTTRMMFGCMAVYVEEKIVLILRQRKDSPADNGVWLATTTEHHESLRIEFPQMRSVRLFGKPVTQWQVLPEDEPDFEEAALRACKLILERDQRIGKVPNRRPVLRARAKIWGAQRPVRSGSEGLQRPQRRR
jgi:hypothetical protein